MKILLASASPRRRELMKLITEDFTACATDADETLPEGIESEKAPEYLAGIKAEAAEMTSPDCLVIGCDTVVIADNSILGKPENAKQCREYLELLSGRTHKVVTGCVLRFNGKSRVFSVSTDVEFFPLDKQRIDWYISTGEPFDKAGGYGIQGKGSLLVKGIKGDYFNVVGLPVAYLERELNSFISEFEI